MPKSSVKSIPCANCGALVTRDTYEVNPQRWFCNCSCAAKANNKRRHSQESRDKVSKSLLEKIQCGGTYCKGTQRKLRPWVECEVCCCRFQTYGQKFCSRRCRYVWEHKIEPYTKETTLLKLQELYRLEGTTPSSKQDGILTHAVGRFFDSWNEAIVAAGLPVNTQAWARKCIRCKDGHRADSLSEKVLDDWFNAQGIVHERNKRYPEGRFLCDFYLPGPNLWVEYFGLHRSSSSYTKTMRVKEDLARKHGLNLIGVFPEDLFPVSLDPKRFQ